MLMNLNHAAKDHLSQRKRAPITIQFAAFYVTKDKVLEIKYLQNKKRTYANTLSVECQTEGCQFVAAVLHKLYRAVANPHYLPRN